MNDVGDSGGFGATRVTCDIEFEIIYLRYKVEPIQR
jgi:hypothetical protein